jgi:hypothetical protein
MSLPAAPVANYFGQRHINSARETFRNRQNAPTAIDGDGIPKLWNQLCTDQTTPAAQFSRLPVHGSSSKARGSKTPSK